MELPKSYDPKANEGAIYKLWEESGFFQPKAGPPPADNPDNLPVTKNSKLKTQNFSIVLPPPNVTGNLHMGHAAMLAIEDILVRFERMRGKKTLWLPGTDHAAIATQEKVERELYKKEGKTRHDLGREEFLRRVETFAKESHDAIVRQIKKMGASLDWSREAFTLDDQRSFAVRTAFKEMYDAGLIYRGHRLVNWDSKLQTTVSDDEIEWIEEKTPFYYLKYGPFVIATARPETKFGDKYVVMHPKDKRYAKYKDGEKIEVEWINGKIMATIIKDDLIDIEFGTGVMTITPWHDAADFDIAERHKLDKEQIIDLKGRLLAVAGEFAGVHIKKARPLIVERLKSKGLLEKVDEKYTHRVATNSRGGGVIEPQIMEQWFVDVNKKFSAGGGSTLGGKVQWKIKGIKSGTETTLKEIMTKVVKSGQIKITPERFEKTYFHWINNLRDWCISRQIWYGHRIPVFYCKAATSHSPLATSEYGKPIVSIEEIKKCPHCGGEIEQDPDTLDTWFSSGLWTFSTLGWPIACAQAESSKLKAQSLCTPLSGSDLEQFHPINVLETGYDILFFWVARMILMTGFLLGDVPFKQVYLHGLVRDAEGQKMSKSLGNTIDPLEMSEKYGADATRLSLIIGNAPGNDMKLSEDKIRGYKHFANKIWNAARFVMMNIDDYDSRKEAAFTEADQKTLAELGTLKKEVTDDLENFRLYLAGEKLYHYFWHTFADKIIESVKPRLASKDADDKHAAQSLITDILISCLKMLHPFVPFVTETIWQKLPIPDKAPLLMIERW